MNLWTIIRNLFFKRVGLVRLYVAETGTPPCEVDERVTWGMKGKSVYAHAGEWITCERGHKICQVTHDIRVGDMQSPDIDFGELATRRTQSWSLSYSALRTLRSALYKRHCLSL